MNRLEYGRTTTAVLAVVLQVFMLASPQDMRGDDMSAGIASGVAVDANEANQAIFPWGNPQFSDGGANIYPRPAWVPAACMDGGLWITNDTWYGWQPSLNDWTPDLATNRLLIQLDRALVSSNLWIAVAGTGESNATLLAGFYDNDLLSVAEPVTLHVAAATSWFTTSALVVSEAEPPVVSQVEPVEWFTMSAAEWPATRSVEWFTNTLDLSQTPSASIISLSTTNGQMRIFCSVLCQRQTTGLAADGQVVSAVSESFAASPAQDRSAGNLSAPAPSPADIGATAVDSADNSSSGDTTVDTPTRPRVWYVNAGIGDDARYNGTAAKTDAQGGVNVPGPKRTITAALANAVPGDTVFVAAGTYSKHVKVDGIRMITVGRVVLQ